MSDKTKIKAKTQSHFAGRDYIREIKEINIYKTHEYMPYGNVTLRNVSSSLEQTGPAWTIEMPRGFAAPNSGREIKFLRGSQ